MKYNKKKRILFVIDKYHGPIAGTERQLQSLINGLSKKGYSSYMVVLRHSEFTKSQSNFDCPILFVDIPKLLSIKLIFGIYKLISILIKKNIDIMHIYFNDASILCPIIGKFVGAKVLVSRRDMGLWYTHTKLMLLRFVNMFVAIVVANSQAVAEVTHKVEKVPQNKIKVIYNGINAVPHIRGNTLDLYKIYNIPLDFKLIGIVANIRPVKRFEVLIDAVYKVIQEYPHIVLVCVGGVNDRNYMNGLEQQIKNLNLNKNIYFTGGVSDPISYMKNFDIAILCSDSEGFSNTLMEYMLNALPIIATDVGGNSELISHEFSGLLIPEAKAEYLAKNILEVLNNQSLAKNLAFNAKQEISKYSIARMVNEHIKLYESLN